MRRIVPMLCVALAACSVGDTSDRHVGPGVAANDRPANDHPVSPTAPALASPERVRATPTSLEESAVISLEDLMAEPELPREQVGQTPAQDRSFSSKDLPPLPPALAAKLESNPYGLGIAEEDDLTIASTPEASDWIALVFGDTSVVDAEPLTEEVDEPSPDALPAVTDSFLTTPEALPAAPVEALR